MYDAKIALTELLDSSVGRPRQLEGDVNSSSLVSCSVRVTNKSVNLIVNFQKLHHHQLFNVPNAGAQAFLMDDT
jgi:hypothetical protein